VQSFKDDSEANYLQVTIHPKLRPYLLELRQKYLVYDIRNVLRLTSVYSVRIYELLKQYEKIGRRSFDIENLKQILGILPEEYKLYGHFKDKVILKAQADLLAETDILFDYEEKKEGKKVVSITFFIRANRPETEEYTRIAKAKTLKSTIKEAIPLPESAFFQEILPCVIAWGVAEQKLAEIWLMHDETHIRDAFECTEDGIKKQKVKENAAGFFIKAVREGWKSGTQNARKQATERQKRVGEERQKKLELLAKLEETLENLLEARHTAVKEVVRILAAEESNIGQYAVAAIVNNNFTKNYVEKSANRTHIGEISLDDWRADPVLREAIIREIEKIRPEAFLKVQADFDGEIRRMRKLISEAKG
jgi:hypothetical protein